MYYVAHCIDRPGAAELRQTTRAAHLDYMAEIGHALILAGPYLDDSGQSVGSMLIFEAESEEAVAAFLAADPYSKAGLFERVEIRPWRWVINPPD